MPAKTLIIFAPHPDDETLGCGGTLAKRIDEGFTPIVVMVTDGRGLFTHYGIADDPAPQQVADARWDESVKALAILGCPESALVALEIPNGELDAQRDRALAAMVALLEQHQPAEVYVTNVHEAHVEHRITNELVKAACAQVGYAGPCYQYIVNLDHRTSLDQITDPRVTIDVSAYRERKRQAVNCFRYHLDVISPAQDKPFVDSFDGYAQDEEVFFT